MTTSTSKALAQLAVAKQPAPKGNSLRPCFALAFKALEEHPELCDVIAARAEHYKNFYDVYQQPSNGRSAYIDGFQQSLDLLLTLVQAVYDTKGDLRYEDEFIHRLNDSFIKLIDTVYLLMEMAARE